MAPDERTLRDIEQAREFGDKYGRLLLPLDLAVFQM
jgi:hypothetical protein